MGRPKGSKNKVVKKTANKAKPVQVDPATQNHAEVLDAVQKEVLEATQPPVDFRAKLKELAAKQQPIVVNSALPEHKAGTGVVMIAVGHPYYAHMACNLAVSLKYYDPDINITLIKQDTTIQYMDEVCKRLFNSFIEVPEHCLTGPHGYDPFKIKLHLDQLTPYENTLFLDADTVWMTRIKPMELIAELSGREFQMASRGRISTQTGELKSRWVDLAKVHELFGYENVYDLSSEVLYFEHGSVSTSIFDNARRLYFDTRLQVQDFGGGKADEAYFMLALEEVGYEMNQATYLPSYWEPMYFPKMHSREYIQNNFALLSLGGNQSSSHIKKIYDSLNRHFHFRMGLKRIPYQLINKKSIMAQRKDI